MRGQGRKTSAGAVREMQAREGGGLRWWRLGQGEVDRAREEHCGA